MFDNKLAAISAHPPRIGLLPGMRLSAAIPRTTLIPDRGPSETVVWCMNDWLVNQFSPGATVHILPAPNKSARGVLLEAFIR